ncbi:MAG: histidine kinase [Blastocatellia bacterium]|nr:histidine kinase [Blastocatellia bacterium]
MRSFCHNRQAMRDEWHKYWQELSRYMPYLPWGLVASMIPFLLNLEYWQARRRLLTGLFISLNSGVIVTLSIWIFLASAYAIITAIRVRTGLTLRTTRVFQIVVGGIGTVSGIWLASYTKARILGEEEINLSWLPALVFGGIISLIFLLHFAYRRAREDALALRAVAAEASYNALEHQMRPHFLFNALNSLAELIESGEGRAAEMTYALSELYRQILANSGSKTAPLGSEIEIARRYLELEQVRFGPRLEFFISIPDTAEDVYVPSLMIQTLVENAVKHSVSKSLKGGKICIEICRTPEGHYRLSVSNTGEPYPRDVIAGTGLTNTRARLDLLYGSGHRFDIGTDEAGRTVASFCFSGEKIE